MSDHVWTEENLDAYIAGGLSLQERSRVDEHVNTCGECAHSKTEICEMEQLMDGIFAPVRPDAALADRAIQKLREKRKPRPSWLRFVTAAAAVIVLGMIGGGVQWYNGGLPLPGMDDMAQANGGKVRPMAIVTAIFGDAKEKESHDVLQFKANAPSANNGYMSEDDLVARPEELLKRTDQLDAEHKAKLKGDPLVTLDGKNTFYVEREATSRTKQSEAEGRGYYARSKGEMGDKAGGKPGESKETAKALDDQNEGQEKSREKVMKEGLDSSKATLGAIPTIPPGWQDQQRATGAGGLGMMGMGGMPAPGLIPGSGMGFGGGFGMMGAGPPAGPSVHFPPINGLPPPKGTPGKPGTPMRGPIATTKDLETGYFVPMPPPPVQVAGGDNKRPASETEQPGQDKGDKKPDDGGAGKGGDEKSPPKSDQGQPKQPPKTVVAQPSGRKIIRTGEMEFETTSFDKSVDSINQLINNIPGGFIATVNSDKLPNGKMKGSVVVRMPPEHLDKFIFELRRELGKTGELKNQRIGSQDVTKQYTDIESRLRAARAIEERLIAIIKTGKGEIKDLVAAERELGIWRTKIEEMEGEIRYYNNQVSLSTLTISIYEKEIQAPTAIVITETVQIRLEVDEVAKAHQTVMKAVEELKGRITRSELKQHTAGQFLSIVHAQIPPAKKEAFLEQLRKLGIVSDFQEHQSQHTEGGTGKAPGLKPKTSDICFEVTMNNTANIRPRQSVDLKVATTDVPAAYTKILEAVTKAKGQIRDGKLNEQDKLNITATLDFNVPASQKTAIDKLLEAIGPVLERINIRAPINEISTESKFGYVLLLRDFASIPPRQSVIEVIAAVDVPLSYMKLQDAIAKAKGQIADAKINEQDKLNINAHITFTVPSEERKAIEKVLESLGTSLSHSNVQAPVHQLATDKKFGFAIALRDLISIPPSKATDLTVAANDVPAAYAKLQDAIAKAKGHIADARLNEQDRFNVSAHLAFTVPTDEKETIDKLLAEIGSILSRSNTRAAANQLAVAKKFGYSINLRDFATILPTHASEVTVAARDVPNSYAKLVEAIVKAKGQISKAILDEKDKLNVSATLHFTVPTTDKAAFDKILAEIGTLLSRNNVQAPLNTLTTETKFGYSLVLRDFANIPPRETFHMQVAAIDVPAAFRELQDAVAQAKGLVSTGLLTEDSKIKMEAKFDFDIPAAERQAIEKAFAKVGAVLTRASSQIPMTGLATDQKVGYRLTIKSAAAIAPRETVDVKLQVNDVDAAAADLRELIAAGKGRVIDSKTDSLENGQASSVITIEIPFASRESILRQVKALSDKKAISQHAKRNPQAPENELTTAHLNVTLVGARPIVPSDEGLGSYVRASLYMSFKVFSVCIMLIILGVSAVLPWVLVVWIVYKVYSRLTSSGGDVQLAADGAPTPQTPETPPH